MSAAITRRGLLGATPALALPLALTGAFPSETSSDTPVMRLFHEWDAERAFMEGDAAASMDEGTYNARMDTGMRRIETALEVAPAETALDMAAKILVLSGGSMWALPNPFVAACADALGWDRANFCPHVRECIARDEEEGA